MITTTLYFENGVDVGGLVDSLQGLPEFIRPVYFSENEGKIVKDNVLENEERFEKFRKRNPTGFFLYGENKTLIDVSTRHVGYSEVALWLESGLSDELVLAFFSVLAEHNPVFGFSCAEDEYKHRNRYYITIGANHIEDWVGRKLEKYIPGVYWYTLLSNKLLAQHSVNLSGLSVEAIRVEALGDGSLHLLKFFEDPEDWEENIERLDNLCEKVTGVFSKRSVEAAVQSVSNYIEYDEIITDWR